MSYKHYYRKQGTNFNVVRHEPSSLKPKYSLTLKKKRKGNQKIIPFHNQITPKKGDHFFNSRWDVFTKLEMSVACKQVKNSTP